MGAEALYALCDAIGVPCDHFRPHLAAIVEEATPAVAPKEAQKK